MTNETLSVTLSAGIVQVLGLDDSALLDAMDERERFEIEYRKSTIRVTGTHEALRKLQQWCSAARDFQGEAWYMRSADAATKAIAKKIGPLHPQWFLMNYDEIEAYAKAHLNRERA